VILGLIFRKLRAGLHQYMNQRKNIMQTWIKSSWYIDFVSTMREAISDGLLQIEERSCRLQTDVFLQSNELHEHPQSLSEKEIITELGKAMTRDRLEGRDLTVYEGVYPFLPAMRQIKDTISSPELHRHIRIPPTPMVMDDRRTPANEFWNETNRQVFVISVND
jgi:hypothetical protein